MNADKDQEDKFLICFSDIMSVFRRSKGRILSWALVLGALGALFALIKPIRYQAEGTFREKATKTSNTQTSILQVLSSGSVGGNENEALSLIKSRKLLLGVIEKLKLQAQLTSELHEDNLLKLIKYNWQIAWTSLTNAPQPAIKDPFFSIQIDSLKYEGEIPLYFILHLEKNGDYQVIDMHHPNQALQGRLGKPFQFEQLSMNLIPTYPNQPIEAQTLFLKVDSIANTVKKLCEDLEIGNVKNDKSVLKFIYTHRNRYTASELINTIMNAYLVFITNNHQEIAHKQLDYLSLRKDHLTQNLINLMQEHAHYLSEDLYNVGFVESQKEMEFLAAKQHEYKEKLMANELEIKRLENITPNNFTYYDRYSEYEGDPQVLNTIFSDIRDLKQERDALEIELQRKALNNGVDLQQSFNQQLAELNDIQWYLIELQEIAHRYQQESLLGTNYRLLNDPRFLLRSWFERLEKIRGEDFEGWKKMQESFHFYLTNLERLFGVHKRILQERLTHQQNPSEEYQGISLKVATDLYLDYSKQLIQMEAMIRQNLFFIHQIEDSNFEITSLSAGLTDPVSSNMIQKASQLVLNLRDQNNQSLREQERIKDELQLQRTFLSMHLKQMVQLMELNKQLMNEKIFALQNVSLELIHQQVSLLEKNLQDYVQSRLYNLQQERDLIQHHLENIHTEMATLPKRWVSENLIEQEVENNQLIVQEIAKMVESKNISHNLEILQSAPIDHALPPVHPIVPNIFLWGILGCLLGAGLGTGLALSKTLSQGLQASPNNLKLLGCQVAGTLCAPLYSKKTQQLQDGNLDTLRRLQAYLDGSSLEESLKNKGEEAKLLLLLEGQGPNYAQELANLFLKKSRRVLTLDLNFTQSQEKLGPGLLQYLQGELASLPIQQSSHGDWIASGGYNRFAVEMMGSLAFQKLIDQLKLKYDWILAVSPLLPCSAEAESLVPLFPYLVVTLQQERVEDLRFYTSFIQSNSHHKLTFIFARNNGKKWR